MATNLDVEKYKNILKGTCVASVAPSLNFMFVPSSQHKHAVAKCCAQLGRVVERLGRGQRGAAGWALQKMLPPFLRLFVIAGKP